MESRVTRLEVEFEHIRRDLDDIKSDQKTVIDKLGKLPTTSGLWTMVASVVGISFAVVGIVFAAATYFKP